MDEKELMQNLGQAINDSLSDSDRIAEAISEIKKAGYDVFLVLEATIGFNKRDEDYQEEAPPTPPPSPVVRSDDLDGGVRIEWTMQDQKFLRALKISNQPKRRGR